MADETASNVDNHHDDEEWESQKDNFTHFYINDGKTLKEATRLMAATFGFHATARQWERKINFWGLNKYTSRRERLAQIEAQGRSIHEVAELGRRPRNFDDNLLHPDAAAVDDRNIRRFARRELNRSASHRERSRSRTNSIGKRPRSTTPHPRRQSAPDDVIRQDAFGLGFSPIDGMTQQDMFLMSGMPRNQDISSGQSHFLPGHNQAPAETNGDILLSMQDDGLISNDMPNYETSQFGFSDVVDEFDRPPEFSPDVNMDPSSPFSGLDEGFGGHTGFIHPPNDMSATETDFEQSPNQEWHTQAAFPPPQIDTTSSMYSGSITGSTSFHQTPTSEALPMKELENVSPLTNRAFSVPDIVLHNPIDAGLMPPQIGHGLHRVSSEDKDVYTDFFAAVESFTSTLYDAAMNTCPPMSPQAENLASIIRYQRSVFHESMTMTLNNFLSTQKRASQSIHEQNQRLKQRNIHLEQENAKSHAHRFSLPTSMNYQFPVSDPNQQVFGPS